MVIIENKRVNQKEWFYKIDLSEFEGKDILLRDIKGLEDNNVDIIITSTSEIKSLTIDEAGSYSRPFRNITVNCPIAQTLTIKNSFAHQISIISRGRASSFSIFGYCAFENMTIINSKIKDFHMGDVHIGNRIHFESCSFVGQMNLSRNISAPIVSMNDCIMSENAILSIGNRVHIESLFQEQNERFGWRRGFADLISLHSSYQTDESNGFYYKKLARNIIAELFLHDDATIVYPYNTRELRADKAYVNRLYNMETGEAVDEAYPTCDGMIYKEGEEVVANSLDLNQNNIFGEGISFFPTEKEARMC